MQNRISYQLLIAALGVSLLASCNGNRAPAGADGGTGGGVAGAEGGGGGGGVSGRAGCDSSCSGCCLGSLCVARVLTTQALCGANGQTCAECGSGKVCRQGVCDGEAAVPPEDPVVPDSGPMVLTWHGGRVLSDAWLVTLAFADVPEVERLSSLCDAMPDSGWLAAVGAGYGVGIRGHSHFTVPGVAPAALDDADVSVLIDQGIDAGWWPAAPGDGGTLLWMVLYPPATIPRTLGYWGEHYEDIRPGSKRVLGWVAPHADGGVGPYEKTLSHEVIEALTDPYVFTTPGWRTTGQRTIDLMPGGGFNGGENADLCWGTPDVLEGASRVTRSWSNVASEAGRDPCVPTEPNEPPWATVWGPTMPVILSAGQRVELTLQPVSGDGVISWPVAVVPWGGLPSAIEVTLAGPVATRGVPLSATVEAPWGSAGSSSVFMIVSSPDGGATTKTPLWITVR